MVGDQFADVRLRIDRSRVLLMKAEKVIQESFAMLATVYESLDDHVGHMAELSDPTAKWRNNGPLGQQQHNLGPRPDLACLDSGLK